jgi:hypothetical protein
VAGEKHHDISFVIAMVRMAMLSFGASKPWAYGIARSQLGRGSIRRDCLDHVVVFGERRLRHLLNSYQQHYNDASCYPTFLCGCKIERFLFVIPYRGRPFAALNEVRGGRGL